MTIPEIKALDREMLTAYDCLTDYMRRISQ